MKRYEQFSRLEDVAAGAAAEILDRDLAHAGPARRTPRDQDRHSVGARRGIAQIATDRRAALNLNAADECGDFGERGVSAADRGIAVQTIARNRGAQRQAARGIVAD